MKDIYSKLWKLKVLGTNLYTKIKHAADDSRISRGITEAKRLGALQIPFVRKSMILVQNIIPAALYGVLYDPPTLNRLEDLRKATTECLWGPHYSTRSSEALLNIVLKGHTHDPLASTMYRMANTFCRLHAVSDVRKRCRKIRRKYKKLKFTGTAGPVGNITKILLKPTGKRWNWLKDVANMGKYRRPHENRAVTKRFRGSQLVLKRNTYAGCTAGIDEDATNAVWKNAGSPYDEECGRRLLTGAFFRLHPLINHTSYKCEGCGAVAEGHDQLLEHTMWECTAHSAIRARPEHSEVVKRKTADLPRCLRIHGVVPKETAGLPVEPKAVQKMLVAVMKDYDRLQRKRQEEQGATHVWRRTYAASEYPVPTLRWFEKNGLRKFAGVEMVPMVLEWLRNLKWTAAGSVSRIELAIDYELTAKVYILGRDNDVRKRANRLALVIDKLAEVVHKKDQPPFMPGQPEDTHALRSIGAPRLSGYTGRPIFAHPKTAMILEKQLALTAPNRGSWRQKFTPI
eukprot:TRINITY_DN1822_c0_g1_i3.p1 TRINITY_DN1822_c0_g1~~TRINITY_DN1822_c0_g1_i3.p1  ORF type:complete len:513 (+),score=80.51 TRINITY_DN1822_c0_g1_i3:1269-2807(+)